MAADQSRDYLHRSSLVLLCLPRANHWYHDERLLPSQKEENPAESPLSNPRLVVQLLEGIQLARYTCVAVWMGANDWGFNSDGPG